jgi:CHAD domain-containing protein
MAYAIEQGERLSDAIPRIVIERIDTARQQLLDEGEDPAERVHNARKRFKESRAVVRLVRFALHEQYSVENAWFRDAGRDLASLRDADAVLEALDKLRDIADGFHQRRVLRRLRRRLAHSQRRSRMTDLVSRIENAASQLPVAKARVTVWPVLSDDFATIGDGLRRTYRDGARAVHHAMMERTPQAFHDLRKRVKDHWYHSQLLRNVWPPVMKSYRDELEQLSQALGDRHDLDVLRQVAVDQIGFGTDFDLRVLHGLIDVRVAELSERAATIGQRIYSEAPDALHNRFESYWTVWQAPTRPEA